MELATIRLKEIKVPALYLAGRYDETSPRATRLCHDALPVIFENSSHLPIY
jgi:pimeloyl-ACP methyl ester carboxylesterase